MMLIKDVLVNRGAGNVRIFIYEEGSRAGIRLPGNSDEPMKHQDFTLEETWEIANALTAAAKILETVSKDD